MQKAEPSNIISNLRFPLMVMVVFIHSYLSKNESMHAVILIENIFSNLIPVIAVPLFLFISGYLYFNKCTTFSANFYKSQSLKRVRTLVIPYIIWNTIVILVFWAIHRFLPFIINPDFENISNFTLPQLLNCYWKGSGGFPIAYQFWFIRDLFIIALASPFIYLLVKCNIWGTIIVFIFFITCYNSYIETGAYFYAGAFCSLKRINFSRLNRIWRVVSFIAYLCFALMFFLELNNAYTRKLLILSGGITVLNLDFIKNKINAANLYSKLSQSSFFLFCLHGIVALFSCKLINILIKTTNQLIWIGAYFLNIICVILFCAAIYWMLRKIAPKFLGIIIGNR